MRQKIAFFDVDGTITDADTMLAFIQFAKGRPRYYLGMLLVSPWLVALRLGLISTQLAKEKLLHFFFNGMPIENFTFMGQRFGEEVLPSMIRPKAWSAIVKHIELGHQVALVTASSDIWLRQAFSQLPVNIISTQLELVNGRITGKISGKNCNGDEKLNRIKENYPMEEYEYVCSYGDTNGDRAMLAATTIHFFKPFR
jgi:HAD superfamily hydrolase (TIGR01490 family)